MYGPPNVPSLRAATAIACGIACGSAFAPAVLPLAILLGGLALTFLPAARRYLLFSLCALTGWVSLLLQTPTIHYPFTPLPAEDITLTVRVTRTFNARNPERFAGLAKIESAPPQYHFLTGHALSFYVTIPESLPADKLGLNARFSLSGRIWHLNALPQPSGFQRFLRSQGVFLSIDQAAIEALHAAPPPLQSFRTRTQSAWLSLLTRHANPHHTEPALTWAALFTGRREILSEQRFNSLRDSGTMHFFAVSGLHVGTVAAFAWWALGFAVPNLTLRALSASFAVLAYAWLTGWSTSAARAAMMAILLLAALPLRRQTSPFAAFGTVACLILICTPHNLWAVGFQLSYAIVAAILLIALPCIAILNQAPRPAEPPPPPRFPTALAILTKVRSAARDTVIIGTTCAAISAPLIIEHFHLFSPIGLLLGWLMVFPVAILVTTATIASTLGSLCPPALWLTNPPAHTLTAALIHLIDSAKSIPNAFSSLQWPFALTGPTLTALTLACAYAIHLHQLHRPNPSFRLAALPVLLPLLALSLAAPLQSPPAL